MHIIVSSSIVVPRLQYEQLGSIFFLDSILNKYPFESFKSLSLIIVLFHFISTIFAGIAYEIKQAYQKEQGTAGRKNERSGKTEVCHARYLLSKIGRNRRVSKAFCRPYRPDLLRLCHGETYP